MTIHNQRDEFKDKLPRPYNYLNKRRGLKKKEYFSYCKHNGNGVQQDWSLWSSVIKS